MSEIPKADDADICARNVYLIEIETETGCNFDDDEYTLRILNVIRGYVGEQDYGLVDEAVREHLEASDLPPEGCTYFIARETGEREDVFWHKYFVLERV